MNNRDLFEYKITQKIKIAYKPLLEWILAAKWANYKIHEFFELDAEWQNTIVAAYRTEKMIEAVVEDYSYKLSERKRR